MPSEPRSTTLTVPQGHAVALVDVRCMYVSCERAFDPDLQHRAVIVLSNNDGTAVSRSAQAKNLGIKMGQPWFEIKRNPRMRDVIAKSSNYALYGDLSSRMTSVLQQHITHVHKYSIDECFCALDAAAAGDIATHIQEVMWAWLSLPVTVGVATTKTLAKIGSHHAKADPAGICDLTTYSPAALDELLANTATADVWGVGTRTTARLAELGVHTALDLKHLDPRTMRHLFTVTGERTVRELNSIACNAFYDEPRSRHQLIYSRLFGTPITDQDTMRHALTGYATTIARRLRRKQLQATVLTASASTSWYSEGPGHHPYISQGFQHPTADTERIAAAAHRLLPQLRPGVRYARATLMLAGLLDAGSTPGLHDQPASPVGAVMDRIVDRYGSAAIGYGHNGLRTSPSWIMHRQMQSPRYTTCWAHLPTAR
ncbi:Y-family DNA polymerase [Mycobacteroides abscessus]|uniref:Y-family DNA polymerase n=1 Tax=Mycobacteroides abscessus TaxID=36809 RepID=UPI0009413FB7|nr:Y-family DNA polymerase [Mycobacteroides abscessus]QCO29047.1 DNA polymerase V subunit UmuC [Mycobacteroides abscessus subsp. massiliense]